MKNLIISTLIAFIFVGCGVSNNNVSKVYEADYPEGISVILHKSDFKDNIKVTNARLVNGKSKKQLQLILNNMSRDVYNIKLVPEWTDRRGVILLNTRKYNIVRVEKESSVRVVLNAPNYKAKDVLLNVECSSNCVQD